MILPDFLTEDADGYIHVTGHRIGLPELIHYYSAGFSAEMLQEAFPTLTLATVHKLIGFYLENRASVDEYLVQCRAEIDRQRAQGSRGPDLNELLRRLVMQMPRLRLLSLTMFVMALLVGCSRQDLVPVAAQRAVRIERSKACEALARELAKAGITVVVDADGINTGLVASMKDEDIALVAPALEAAHIGWLGSCGHGVCGMYVDIADFETATKILREERTRHGIKFWIAGEK